jgi:hypothetical protein
VTDFIHHFNHIWVFFIDFDVILISKFHVHPYIGSPAEPYEGTDWWIDGRMGRWADMKIIGTCRGYANAPRNLSIFGQCVPPLEMLEVKVCISNTKYCFDKIDNSKRDLTLGNTLFCVKRYGT